MYAPPPLGYAWSVWRYEKTTIARIDAMIDGDGARERQRAHVDEDQDPQNLFGRVRDRRQRIGRQHGEAGDAGETFVMGQMRRDRLADDEPLDLAE